jgi:hypothetical protein
VVITGKFDDVLDHVERGPSNDMYLTARHSGANGVALKELWDDLGSR